MPVAHAAGRHPGSPRTDLHLLRGSVSGGAVSELALTRAVLDRVAAEQRAMGRLYRPGATLAFGRVDTHRPGFGDAVRAARAHGFDPAIRAPGGRAAAYHERSIVLDLAVPDPDPRAGIGSRFAATAELVVAALREIGVLAEPGELPGEYCPGQFSVLADGRKLGGIAQRVVAGASLTSIALVVDDGDRVRGVLGPVSHALGYAFDPATAGAVSEVTAGIAVESLAAALEQSLAGWYRLRAMVVDDALRDAAARREPDHRVPSRTPQPEERT